MCCNGGRGGDIWELCSGELQSRERAHDRGSEEEAEVELELVCSLAQQLLAGCPIWQQAILASLPQSSGHSGRQSVGISSQQAAVFVDGGGLAFPVT